MTLPRADGDLPIFRPERRLVGQFVDSRVAPKQDLRRAVRQDGGPDRRPMILALASGRRRGGGEASDGRHFEILLNLTFGRAPPSKGLPSKA
jgi:hypothetical protein